MITCLIGTRAQLIKMAPILRELESRRVPFHFVLSGQHKETMDDLLTDFRIRTTPVIAYRGGEASGLLAMLQWMMGFWWAMLVRGQRLLPTRPAERNIVLVHGDTFSTLLGAMAGKLRRLRVAHIEAGLRSHNLLHPFPEELTRILTSLLSDLSFCPGDWACTNLRNRRTEPINTQTNTLCDAVRLALEEPHAGRREQWPERYGVCSLHRFENILRKSRLRKILALVEIAAQHCPLVFVLHPATKKRLQRFDMLHNLRENPRILLSQRMGFVAFIRLLSSAQFVITDGGSNQEELSYLGVPTLLMREATERLEGLGATVTISHYDENIVRQFVQTAQPFRHNELPCQHHSPSSAIVDRLLGL